MPIDTAPHPMPPSGGEDPTVADLTVADPTVVLPAGVEPAPVTRSEDEATLAHPSASRWSRDDGAAPPPGGPPSPPPGPASGSGPGGERPPVPFARDRPTLRRAGDDAYLGGVAGGIARRLDVEPVVVRVVLGVAAIASFGLVASLYAAAWLLLPDDHEEEGPGVRWYREHERDTVSLVLAAVGALVLAGALTATWGGLWGGDDGGWFAGLLMIGVAAIAHRRRTGRRGRSADHADRVGAAGDDADADPHPWGLRRTAPDPVAATRRRRHRLARNATLAAAATAGSVAAILWGTGAWHVSGWVVPALVLGILLVGLAAAPWVGWSWTLTGAALVVLPLLVLASIPGVSLRGGIGVRIHAPRTVAEIQDRYQLGLGELEVDLSELTLAPGSTTAVWVGIGAGEATVQVPADVDVVLRGHVSGGTVLVDGEDIDVRGADVDFERSLPSPSVGPTGDAEAGGRAIDRRPAPELIVDVHVGFGQVDLRRTP